MQSDEELYRQFLSGDNASYDELASYNGPQKHGYSWKLRKRSSEILY